MKKLLYILPFLLLFGCKPTQYVPLDNQTVIVYHDSTIWHEDTIHISIEREAYNYYAALLDTLKMETQYAYSTAYIDTTNNLLNGYMTNKQVDLPVVYKWRDRVIQHDTTIYKEKPVYITVPDTSAEVKVGIYKRLLVGVSIVVLVLCGIIIIKTWLKK